MGHRGEIHNWVLRKTGPNINLVQHFRPKNQPLPPELQAAASKEGLLVAFLLSSCRIARERVSGWCPCNAKGAVLFTERLGLSCFNRFTGTSAGRATASLGDNLIFAGTHCLLGPVLLLAAL